MRRRLFVCKQTTKYDMRTCLESRRVLFRSISTVRSSAGGAPPVNAARSAKTASRIRSEEHTSELQSRPHLVCRLLLAKKKNYSAILAQLLSQAATAVPPVTPYRITPLSSKL